MEGPAAHLSPFPAARKKYYIVFFLVTIALFLALRIPFLGKEYAPEEAAWIRGGQGVAQTGFPWVYLGEQSKGGWAHWKGPLFPLLLGGAFKLFGEHENVARSVPLIFSLGQIILIYLLCRRLFGENMGSQTGLLATFLVSISPFAIQNSVQIDIDGGLVGFFALLVLYVSWPFFKNKLDGSRLRLFLSAIGLFLVRFDVALIVFFSLVVFALLQKKYRLAKIITLLFLSSIIAAVILFGLYNASLGQLDKTLDPFKNLLGQVAGSFFAKAGLLPRNTTFGGVTAPATRLYEVFPGVQQSKFAPFLVAFFPTLALSTVAFVWVTLPLAAILIFLFVHAVKKRWLQEQEVLFTCVPALIILGVFLFVAPSFNYPRYLHTPLILTIVVASYWTVSKTSLSTKPFSAKLAMRSLAILFIFLVLLTFTPAKTLLFDDRVRSGPLAAGLALATTFVASFLAGVAMEKEKNIRAFLGAAFLGYVAFATIIVIKDFRKPYSLNAYYGNYGFREAGEFLKNFATHGETVVTVDTIGYYFNKPYYDINSYDPAKIQADLIVPYRVPPSRFLVLIDGKKKLASFGTVEIYSTKK